MSDLNSTWIGVDVDLRQNGQEFACVLPAATFAEGQYTLVADVKPYGLTITVR